MTTAAAIEAAPYHEIDVQLKRGGYKAIVLEPTLVLVSSQKDLHGWHRVNPAGSGKCDCKAWIFRATCAHLEAARLVTTGEVPNAKP